MVREVHSIEDPVAFLWACAIAHLLEFSLALVWLRVFYAVRESVSPRAILRRLARRIQRLWQPPFELGALGKP